MNCCVRFGFTAGFVLVVSSGSVVSFYTTVGGCRKNTIVIKMMANSKDK